MELQNMKDTDLEHDPGQMKKKKTNGNKQQKPDCSDDSEALKPYKNS